MKKPVATVLGGVPSHIPLIENLKNRGYYTVLIDYLDNPPAKESADEHVQVSTLDRERVLEVAKNKNAAIVICACLDQPIPVACYVSKSLGLPHLYDYETSLSLTDKSLMKKILISCGIPTAKYMDVYTTEKTDNRHFRFPVVVKPADSTGSQGVRIARNNREMELMIQKARKISLSDRVLIEEYMPGRELGVDCFVKNGDVKILMIREKVKLNHENLDDSLLLAGSIYPISLSQHEKNEVKLVANKIAEAFGIMNGPLLLQGVIDNQQFSIIEVAGRVGGGMNHKNILAACTVDVISETINAWIGNDVNINIKQNPGLFHAVNYIYARNGVFSKVAGLDALLNEDYISSYIIVKPYNSEFPKDLSSKNQVAKVIVKAKTHKALVEKIKHLFRYADIIDKSGESLMLKDHNMINHIEKNPFNE